MSHKARRRPSWKAYRKTEDAFVLHILNEEDGTHLETIRVPGLGHFGRHLIREYGQAGAEAHLRQFFIDLAEKIVTEETP